MGYAINSVGGWRWVDTSAEIVTGETYSATVPTPTPTHAQSAALASVSGLTITLTGAVPGGGSSYPMKDATTNGPNGEGAWHTFTAAEYRTVAGAISTFVAGCDLIADGNPMSAASLPASSVTIPV